MKIYVAEQLTEYEPEESALLNNVRISILSNNKPVLIVEEDDFTLVTIRGVEYEPVLSYGAKYVISELLQSNDLSDIVNKYNAGGYDAEEVEKELAEWMKS